jgi:hypothetical protein
VEVHVVPPALRSTLGPEATAGLLELLESSHRTERAVVIAACSERFERRLADELSKVRVEIARLGAALRTEMADIRADLRETIAAQGADLRREMAAQGADLRQALAAQGADLRQAMAAQGADLRHEMAGLRADLRQEIAAGRVELFKWCFLFWIGQVLAIGGLMSVMLRLAR